MSIRLLNKDDAVAYKELRLYALQESPTAFGTAYEEEIQRPLSMTQQRIVQPGTGGFTLGDFDNARLVGVTTMLMNDRVKMNHSGAIVGVYVHPDVRGQGRGRALMEMTIDRCRSISGLKQVQLSVVTTNTSAKALYESLGFKVYGIEPRALLVDDIYYDEAHMILMLDAD